MTSLGAARAAGAGRSAPATPRDSPASSSPFHQTTVRQTLLYLLGASHDCLQALTAGANEHVLSGSTTAAGANGLSRGAGHDERRNMLL